MYLGSYLIYVDYGVSTGATVRVSDSRVDVQLLVKLFIAPTYLTLTGPIDLLPVRLGAPLSSHLIHAIIKPCAISIPGHV